MPLLRRHQLAHLGSAAWRDILSGPWDDVARACLQHWADHALPLVVTRQCAPHPQRDDGVALGLSAPARWGRRPLSLRVAHSGISWLSEFPRLRAAIGVCPREAHAPLRALEARLASLDVRAHVYGSAGWQQLSGLHYVHERSDIDLWLAVDGTAQADDAVAALQACASPVRIDGELMFPDGSAVAWREWAAWRAGRCSEVLVKRLYGSVLASDAEVLANAGWCAA
ncbi:malonate decarboxylase holo-[acyl-carrier-protein] synthase [Ideonella margarita]|uniref:Malonate decarboxylase holo-[acyl-carrier-protein] synthase n=1 Tax=Ideonella margarita TaxID=2984191 RepID=A0ABU9C1M9_9BURK